MVGEVATPRTARHLPRDPKRGVPVPWFVAWVDGVPEWRVSDKFTDAVRFDLCWVCGRPRGRWGTFVIGPMCGITRVTAEPPCHRECATWSVQVCPFMTRPHARRRERGLPEASTDPAGIMLHRNPGVALLWNTREWRLQRERRGGLFRLGDPAGVQWWACGRAATRAEVQASIQAGLPTLRQMAERDGQAALRDLEVMVETLTPLLPAATHTGLGDTTQ